MLYEEEGKKGRGIIARKEGSEVNSRSVAE